jgi:hypothetical protein
MGPFLARREETTPQLHQKLGREMLERFEASVFAT